MGTVAIIGAGVMGETLLSGLLRAGRRAEDLVVAERREDRAAELTERYGVKVLGNTEAAALADTLVLVVKPQDMGGVLNQIRRPSPGGFAGGVAGRRHHHRVPRVPAGPRGRSRASDAEHSGTGGRGYGGDLAGFVVR